MHISDDLMLHYVVYGTHFYITMRQMDELGVTLTYLTCKNISRLELSFTTLIAGCSSREVFSNAVVAKLFQVFSD